MNRYAIAITALLLASAALRAADDVIVDGVEYRWSTAESAYYAAGWDGTTHIESLHIRAVVNGLDVYGVGEFAFEDNSTITTLRIDPGITTIEQNAFSRCSSLSTVILPEGLEFIGQEAFSFCQSLSFIVIPSTVTRIDDKAFMHCTGVTDAYFLMTETTQLDAFAWVDGVYNTPAVEPHGGIEFNTNEHTVIRVPSGTRARYVSSGKFEAWLGAIEEDDATYPLWWIVNFGVVGRSYTISDDLTAVHVDAEGSLLAKDDNHWLTPDRVYNGEEDFIATTSLMAARAGVYDQSNWVALTGLASADSFTGYKLSGESVTGVLRDKVNPVIEVTSTPVKGAASAYTPNVYIPASLMGRSQVATDGRTYAFVQPKPQELASYDWTVYGGDNDFYLPAPNKFKGGFAVKFDLYEGGNVPHPVYGGYYPFSAITRAKVDTGAAGIRLKAAYYEPFVDGGKSEFFDVFPLQLPSDPVTAVERVTPDEQSRPTDCYDLHGRRVNDITAPGIYIRGNDKVIVR